MLGFFKYALENKLAFKYFIPLFRYQFYLAYDYDCLSPGCNGNVMEWKNFVEQRQVIEFVTN